MPDREKVIEWLKEISLRPCDFTTEDFDATQTEHLADDAIALLREHEPKWMDYEDTFTGDKFKVPLCGNCESLLSDALYCPRCGKKVKWDA